jgi:glycosyltransferase involved in cell wall biosynthesis
MARLLIKAWQGAGHAVELASTFRSYDRGDGERQARLKAMGKRLANRLIARYQTRPPDQRPGLWFTYHLYHKAPDWLGPTVSAALDIPYVVAEASFAPKQQGGPWDLGHRATAQALGGADLVLGFNAADGACIAPLLQKSDRQILVPPFIDTTLFHQASVQQHKHRQQVARRYGLDPDASGVPRLLCVAMMRPDQKLLSYQHLGKALAKILDRPWQLLVVGTGPAEGAVKQALSVLGDRVTWLGGLSAEDDLPALYAGTDIFVWPAIKEAYGMVFLEALSAGLPVVAGRSPGVAGIVSHQRNGILVDVGDVGDATAFAHAIVRLIDDEGLRANLSRQACLDMVAGHDVKAMSVILGNHAQTLTLRCAS